MHGLCTETVWLEFNQYTLGSHWRQAAIDRKNHHEEGNEAAGFYGGIRKLSTKEEICIWERLWPTETLVWAVQSSNLCRPYTLIVTVAPICICKKHSNLAHNFKAQLRDATHWPQFFLLYRAFEGVQSAVADMMFMSFALCSTFWSYIFISFASPNKVLPGLGKGLKKISRNQEDGLHGGLKKILYLTVRLVNSSNMELLFL